jgi:branched-chain amino acid aminotransferase
MTDAGLPAEDAIPGPVAWLGDRLVPHDQACFPVWDLGWAQGIAVAEQLRTVKHQLWGLDGHLDRLERGLAVSGIVPPGNRETIAERLRLVAESNAALLRPEDDLSVFLSVSAGSSLPLSPRAWSGRSVNAPADTSQDGSGHEAGASPRFVIWATPIAVWRWRYALEHGLHLTSVSVPELPLLAAPRELKSRSRMHYWLAEQAGCRIAPDSLPLLAGTDGQVAGCSIGSVALIDRQSRAIRVPLPEQELKGVTLGLMAPLIESLGYQIVHQSLTARDVATADEIIFFSTPVFALPVGRFDGQPAGAGCQGEFWLQFVSALTEQLGMDPWQQARTLLGPT